MDKKENLLQKCQSCGKRNFVTDNVTGEIFCKNCGYVIPEQVLETNLIPYNIDKCKTGAPTSLAKYDMGLSTVIGPANQDATGKPLSTSMKKHIKTLKLHDNRSLSNPSTERNLKIAFKLISELNIKDYKYLRKKTPISGKLIMFTGGFINKSRSELKSLAENMGAKIVSNIRKKKVYRERFSYL